jgi:hypothetical protein
MIFIPVSGQKTKVTSDFKIIAEIEAAKSLSDKWELQVGVKSWFEKDASQFGELNIDAGIGYQPIKHISIGAGYRWSKNRNKYDDFITSHRFSGEIDIFEKIERFRFDYRICFQNIDDEILQDNENNPSRNILRNRIQLKYNIRNSKLTPFLLAEHYGRLYSDDDYGIKIKSEIGFSYNLKIQQQLKVYYRIDRELNNKNPFVFYNLGICYLIKF